MNEKIIVKEGERVMNQQQRKDEMHEMDEFDIVIDYNKSKATLTIGEHMFKMKHATGRIVINPFEQRIFARRATNMNPIKRLKIMTEKYRIDFDGLMTYIANATIIRPKHFQDIVHIPLYIAKVILDFLLKEKLIVFTRYGYMKTKDGSMRLLEYKLTLEHENVKFVPIKERETDATYEGEESWELFAKTEGGIDLINAELERIKNAALSKSEKKRLLMIGESWKKKALNREREMKQKKSEYEQMKDIIEEEKREAEVFDEQEKKKKKGNGKYNDPEPEYDDDENRKEDPSIVRRHFRKKRLHER